jgi:hypothetical protein
MWTKNTYLQFHRTGFVGGTRFALFLRKTGAGDGIRTRNPQLGKLMRYRCATPAQEGGKKIVKDLIRVNPRPQSALIRVEVTRNQVVPTAL